MAQQLSVNRMPDLHGAYAVPHHTKARALESRANETRERIQAKYDVDVARMARNRLKDRAEILANHQAVRASLEDQANLVTTVGNHPICHPSAKRLCSEPSCRLGFDPERVPAHVPLRHNFSNYHDPQHSPRVFQSSSPYSLRDPYSQKKHSGTDRERHFIENRIGGGSSAVAARSILQS